MKTPRISASSYSNTAPLVWPFLYGSQRGAAELILDNAPARSAELLSLGRVDAALVPIIAYQSLENVKLVPGVCVGAREKARSVCLVTSGIDIEDARSVALDRSSRTSVALAKIVFREFLANEPEWREAEPDIDAMLDVNDAALLIGDPSLKLAKDQRYRVFDMVELWRKYTGLGFIFAMWMSRETIGIDFAAARDEGLKHAGDIATNYAADIGLSQSEMLEYLTNNIAYTPSADMIAGADLYFQLAKRHCLVETVRPLEFI
jgi:chorismate dehydratase